MPKLTVIVTMAGEGSRFRTAGYDMPKFMIEAKGQTLFDWSMDSLTGIDADSFVFVVQKKDAARTFIEEHMKRFKNIDVAIIEIKGQTDGQATTALLAMDDVDADSRILIYNIDTYVEPPFDCIPSGKCDGYIPCFKAPGDHWSFVLLNGNGDAVKVTEKERVSDNCSIGAYYFSSKMLYRKAYDKYYSEESNLLRNEKYIAPMYNQLIDEGHVVKISNIPADKVHVLGTPEELAVFLKQ